MDELNEAVWEAIQNRIKHLTWKCGECSKMKECEEHTPTNKNYPPLYYEPRYCQSLLRAAIFEEVTFPKPFPIDPELIDAAFKE